MSQKAFIDNAVFIVVVRGGAVFLVGRELLNYSYFSTGYFEWVFFVLFLLLWAGYQLPVFRIIYHRLVYFGFNYPKFLTILIYITALSFSIRIPSDGTLAHYIHQQVYTIIPLAILALGWKGKNQ